MPSSVSTTPLLESADGEGTTNKKKVWLEKVIDIEEAKHQICFSLPMILTNVFYYCIPLVSVMFAGHLGPVQLAGATLANSWATVTGFALMTGLSGSLETLCGQGFGAKQYRMLGIYLQSSCIISFSFSVIISIVWFYTEEILLLLHQDPLVSQSAALYVKYLIPGLFAYSFLQNILRFLQTQSIVSTLMVFSAISLGIHFGVVYGLVHWTALQYKGAALATSVSMWLSVLLLVFYIIRSEKFNRTWEGFSFDSFNYVLTNFVLSLPSAAMVCLEYWACGILVFLAGIMPNSALTTSLVAMCVSTEAIAYMLTYGLSASASTRVSNELGAGNSDGAKKAMFVSLKLSLVLALALVVVLLLGHNYWAAFFTGSPSIITEFASMTPFLVISITLDSVQGVLSGVARGCGWQHLAVYANLTMYYLIGMPVAVFLGFKLKLYAKGLWIGLICGLFSQTAALLFISLSRNWTRSSTADK